MADKLKGYELNSIIFKAKFSLSSVPIGGKVWRETGEGFIVKGKTNRGKGQGFRNRELIKCSW